MYKHLSSRTILAFVLFFTSLVFHFTPSTEASTAVKVEIDGELITFDQGAMIIGSRTMVPMRKIFEELDSYVEWNNQTKTITAIRGSKRIVLTIGSNTAIVNGQKITLDTPAQIVNTRTLIPLRFISEALGAKVDWNSQLKTVSVVTFQYADRYYFVDRDSLAISEVITASRFDAEFYNAHHTTELIADEVITFLLDDEKLFYSEHTGWVANGNTYDAHMILEGAVINGKASGNYVIYLYDINTGELATEYSGAFIDVSYDRNIKMTIQQLLDQNHNISF